MSTTVTEHGFMGNEFGCVAWVPEAHHWNHCGRSRHYHAYEYKQRGRWLVRVFIPFVHVARCRPCSGPAHWRVSCARCDRARPFPTWRLAMDAAYQHVAAIHPRNHT